MTLKKKKKTKRKKLPSLQSLRKKAWALFSIWVRMTGAHFNGYNSCYTCYKFYHWKDLQAGHFIHGSHDFDPMNVKPQCQACNKWGHGKPLEYYLHLVREYGPTRANYLRTRDHWNAYNRNELKRIIEKYSTTKPEPRPDMVQDV